MSLDVYLTRIQKTEIYEANITHNLAEMAEQAGLYEALWRPDQIGIKMASQLIPVLQEGLEKLSKDPEYYKQFNPINGWETYESLLKFVSNYLKACMENTDAEINVSR